MRKSLLKRRRMSRDKLFASSSRLPTTTFPPPWIRYDTQAYYHNFSS